MITATHKLLILNRYKTETENEIDRLKLQISLSKNVEHNSKLLFERECDLNIIKSTINDYENK